MNMRIRSIDYLKTLAILGVVFYHIGALTNGYLGVEIFFVVSGFLFIRSNKKNFEGKNFKPFKFLLKKVAEFWPLIAIGGLVSLAMGYLLMLPDDYENLSESVVASNFFGNNVLQAITTKNYWDIGNTYKPLMHTWYIGVLLQCFVVLALTFWIGQKVSKKDITRQLLIALGAVSLVLYLLPIFSNSDKFYYPQYRLFEIAIGGLIAYAPEIKIDERKIKLAGTISVFLIAFLLLSGINLPSSVLLILVVLATSIVIYSSIYSRETYALSEKAYAVLSAPGKYSYDIYIWHQIVIAFLYYSVFQTMNIYLIICVFLITAALSTLSIFIRKKLSFTILKKIICSSIVVVLTTAVAMLLYMHAGVVRNVPELGIDVNNVHRNMHAEYVDIPYSWDKDFEDPTKIHVLVLGNSFGRDFANILNESSIADLLEISYIYGDDASDEMDRVEQADFVFYGANGWGVSKWLTENVDADKFYVVGNKGFGNSNGIIYINRDKDWYFDQTVKISDEFLLQNNAMRGIYGDHYIDMTTLLLNEDKEIRVFSDDGYYISQDCRHLTKYGAQYYSRILDLSFITDGRENE